MEIKNSLKSVKIRMQYNEKLIQFEITDEGNGFDLNMIPDPTKDENIENPHGRGIFLMQKLSDEFNYNKESKTFLLKFFPERYKELV